jgi:DNA-binding MarR family transcriptional regulator
MENSTQWPFDVYQGGRFISAISRNKNLNTLEKMILLTIGGELDFRDIQGSQRYISNATLAEYTSMSIASVKRLTAKLSADGYLVKTDRFDDNNRQQSNLYSLSPKVFIEYVNSTEGITQSPMRVSHRATNLPQKELPQEEIISKDIIIGVDTEVSPDNSPPAIESVKKTPKPRKNSPKEKARRLFKGVYRRVRQDNEPPGKFIRYNTNEQMDTVFERLWGKYDLKAFQASYDFVENMKLLGAILWNPNKIEEQILEAIEWRNANDNS